MQSVGVVLMVLAAARYSKPSRIDSAMQKLINYVLLATFIKAAHESFFKCCA